MDLSVIEAQQRRSVEDPGQSQLLWVLAPALLLSVISSRLPASYDEVYWLATVRKLAAGGRLYDTVIDNKGPLWYPIFTLFERVPVAFWLTRALVVAIVAALLFWLADTCMKNTVVAAKTRHLSAASMTLAVVTLSSFHLTVELFGALLVLISLVAIRRAPVGASLVLFAALMIDPRVALLLPAVGAVGIGHRTSAPRSTRRVTGPLALGLAVAIGIYLLVPNLRFAVVEIGTATRSGEPFSWISTGTAALSALTVCMTIVVLELRPAGRKITAAAWLMAAGASLLALFSLAPFTHYWTYLPLAGVLLVGGAKGTRVKTAWWLTLLLVSLLPTVLFGIGDVWDDRAVETAFTKVDPALSAVTSPTDRVAVFTADPQPVARFPQQSLGRAPVSFYLGMDTGRQDLFLDEFEEDLKSADMLWIETLGKDVRDMSPKEALVPAWQILLRHIDDYSCGFDMYPLLVMVRDPESCASLGG